MNPIAETLQLNSKSKKGTAFATPFPTVGIFSDRRIAFRQRIAPRQRIALRQRIAFRQRIALRQPEAPFTGLARRSRVLGRSFYGRYAALFLLFFSPLERASRSRTRLVVPASEKADQIGIKKKGTAFAMPFFQSALFWGPPWRTAPSVARPLYGAALTAIVASPRERNVPPGLRSISICTGTALPAGTFGTLTLI